MPDQYAVIGHPVAHSKSPWIHGKFAQQLGQDIRYSLLESAPENFHKTVFDFVHRGGSGLNVTLPFKKEAWAMANELSDHAKLAGAVNTLSFLADGSIRGDNTDGIGLVKDLTENQRLNLKGRKLLILGAGGAVRGVIRPLLEQCVERIHIANRTVQKATELAALFGQFGDVSAGSYEELGGEGGFDVIINGTASSLSGDLPPVVSSVLAKGCHAYDMMYSAEKTVFEQWCAANGAASTSDGLGMLVEQAAESFLIWRGIRPHTHDVLKELSQQLTK
ncbi:MAG: shikimate dehydrogenase [Proteobacteria bacterium]|nr:MAG: shikimate dehydrogenase [Pseudomonadota bacterium]